MSCRNVLTLLPQDPEFVASAFGKESRRFRRREGERLDIVIDGRPLRSWWRDWEQPEWEFEVPVADLVTRLSRSSTRAALHQIRQLRGPTPDQEPTITELFYCGACFDISDGILGVQISRSQDTVTWQRLGWIEESGDIPEDALIPNAIDFSFDAAAYDRALDEAQSALTGIFRWRRNQSPQR